MLKTQIEGSDPQLGVTGDPQIQRRQQRGGRRHRVDKHLGMGFKEMKFISLA